MMMSNDAGRELLAILQGGNQILSAVLKKNGVVVSSGPSSGPSSGSSSSSSPVMMMEGDVDYVTWSSSSTSCSLSPSSHHISTRNSPLHNCRLPQATPPSSRSPSLAAASPPIKTTHNFSGNIQTRGLIHGYNNRSNSTKTAPQMSSAAYYTDIIEKFNLGMDENSNGMGSSLDTRIKYDRLFLLEMSKSDDAKKLPRDLEYRLEELPAIKRKRYPYYNPHYYDPHIHRYSLGPTQLWDSELQQWVVMSHK